MKYPPVIVIWDDASTEDPSEHFDPEDCEYEPSIYRNIGFLIKEEEEGIVLAIELCPETGSCRGKMNLPRGMIKDIIYLDG